MGGARVQGGQASRGFALIAEALALARELDDPHLTAYCLIEQMHPNGPTGATAREREAVQLCEKIGDRRLTVSVLANIGYRELMAGDARSARSHLESALAAAQELNFPREVVVGLLNLGFAAHLEGDTAASTRCFVDAARKTRLLGNPPLTAYALLGAALTVEASQQESVACSLHGAADSLFEQAGLVPDPLESRLRDESRLRLRRAVGNDRFEAMYQAGRALSITDAINLAASTELSDPRADFSQAAPRTRVL